MKKALSLTLALLMLLCMSGMQVFAADASAKVYVTISNGTIVLTQEAVTVTDVDKDGKLTIDDALYLAHEAKYTGGAAAGYAAEVGSYGLAITKLWGVANGGSYGYYVNSKSASGLSDTVKDGDYIDAYIYTDTSAFSDTYCYFDARTADADGELTLTLSAAGYDADFNPIVKPVVGAVITVDGKETSYKTDSDGKVTVRFDTVGSCVVSAKSASATLVPPVCAVNVTAAAPAEDLVTSSPDTGADSSVLLLTAAVVISAAALVVVGRKKAEEK